MSAKQSFDKVFQENRDLKAYIENLKQHFQRESQKQQLEFLKQHKTYYNQPRSRPKNYKKVIFEEEEEEEEESENEPEFEEEEELENEEVEQEPQIKKAKKNNKSSNVFEYINKNVKRHKR